MATLKEMSMRKEAGTPVPPPSEHQTPAVVVPPTYVCDECIEEDDNDEPFSMALVHLWDAAVVIKDFRGTAVSMVDADQILGVIDQFIEKYIEE